MTLVLPRGAEPGLIASVKKLSIVTLSLLATGAFAEDWPEFRGPTGMGYSTASDVPVKWARADAAWTTPVPGQAWSSPIVIGSAVFVTTAVQDGDDLSLRALGIKASDGSVVWDEEVLSLPSTRQHKKNSHASPTPIFEDGKVYVHFGHYGSAALDSKTGKILWKQSSLEYPPVHGTGSSPIIVGDKFIYSADGKEDPLLIALNKNTGKVEWKAKRDVEVKRTFSFATPLAIEIDGETQVISPASGAVIAYDPDNGKEIWRVRYGEGYSVVPRPIYADGLLYVCSGFDTATVYAVKPGGKGDLTDTNIVWEHGKSVPRESTPIVVDGVLYMNADNGVASALDAKTGDVLWQGRLAAGGYSASPVYAGGLIYFHNENGVTTVIKPGKELEVVAENTVDEHGLSSFAVTDGAIFVRTDTSLLRIGK